jgi:hypothetical protein
MRYEYARQWNGKFRVQVACDLSGRVERIVAGNLSRAEAKGLADELMTCACGHHLSVHYDTGPNPGCFGCGACPAGRRHAHRQNRLGHPFKDHCGCVEFSPRSRWDAASRKAVPSPLPPAAAPSPAA